jgi:hypothetical protein
MIERGHTACQFSKRAEEKSASIRIVRLVATDLLTE